MNFNSYFIDEVTANSTLKVLNEMTELLIKECEIRYYMEGNSTETNKKSEDEYKGFTGFLKRIKDAIVGFFQKIKELFTGKKKQESDKQKQELEKNEPTNLIGNQEYINRITAYVNSDEEFNKSMNYDKRIIEPIKKVVIQYYTNGKIVSPFGPKLNEQINKAIESVINSGNVIPDMSQILDIDKIMNSPSNESTLQEFNESSKQLIEQILPKLTTAISQEYTKANARQQELMKSQDSSSAENQKEINELKTILKNCSNIFNFIGTIEDFIDGITSKITHIQKLCENNQLPQIQSTVPETAPENNPGQQDTNPQANDAGEKSQKTPQQLSPQQPNPVPTPAPTPVQPEKSQPDQAPQQQTQTPEQPTSPPPAPVVQPPQQVNTPSPQEQKNPQQQQTVQQSTQNDSSQPQGEGSIDYKIATDENELKNYAEDHDVNFYTPGESLAGEFTVRDDNNMPARGSISVIDGKAYPNALYYKNLTNGQTSQSHVENLKNLFDFENVGNNKTLPPLKSIIPAIIDDRNGPDNVKLIRRGKLIF